MQDLEYKRLGGFKSGLFTDLVDVEETKPKTKCHLVKHFYATNNYGVVQVLKYKSNKEVEIKFLEDNSHSNVSFSNLRHGMCRNKNVEYRSSVQVKSVTFEDKIYKNLCGLEYKIIWRLGKDCEVLFLATGNRFLANYSNAASNSVYDYMHKNVLGVGCIGPCKNVNKLFKFQYKLWYNMMNRVYNEKNKRWYKGRAVVDSRWHNFTNFLEDLVSIKNYQKWLDNKQGKSPVKYNLDKDFAYDGCNVYSKETCQFIEESLNKRVTSRNPQSRSIVESYGKKTDD